MKRIASFVFIAFASFGLLGTPSTAFSQALPPCPETGMFSSWKNDCFGTETSASGKYVGEWQNDKWHGQGTYTFPDGEKYVGGFKDALYHGQGTLYAANGEVLQQGTWENHEFVGP